MAGVSRDNDAAGGDLIPSQTTVFADFNLVIIDNDAVAGHGLPPHAAPTIPAGKQTGVYANNKLVVIAGDDATCGHLSSGSGDVFASNSFISIPSEVTAALEATNNQQLANLPSYAVKDTNNQVSTYYPPTPEAGVDALGTGSEIMSTSAAASDIPGFLTQVLTEAANNQWDETRPTTGRSNTNIINLWSELGIGKSGMWADDQTPWCAGFVNWVLKRTGYRYMKSARAFDFRDKTGVYNGTSIPIRQAQPGDIVVWDYSHVNFLYSVKSNGTYTFVGGNQSDSARNNNNPSNGSVTNSWTGGWQTSNGRITGIYRPTKS